MKQKYEHIQLLRALACIGVFITHLAPRLGATGKAAWLANQGAAGVYLFFVLSGYLACCDRKLPTAGKKELLTYYKKRLVRILPLYYGVILYNILLHGLILKDIPADPQSVSSALRSDMSADCVLSQVFNRVRRLRKKSFSIWLHSSSNTPLNRLT